MIAQQEIPPLEPALYNRLSEVAYSLAKFDALQAARDYNLPALMLRSESSSSSQIEQLTSSVKNVALAELSDAAPSNARLIASNVRAMRAALAMAQAPLDAPAIIGMHAVLMDQPQEAVFRSEQVWIGGTPYSPHDATFVPPHASRVDALMQDWLAFIGREDVNPLVKIAIAHAQFETIHPFIDGNGRTGRALMHTLLAQEGLVEHTALPLSAGLLHNVERYLAAMSSYQEGDIAPVVEELTDALETAVVLGGKLVREVDALLEDWNGHIRERRTSAMYRLPALLVEQPVVNVAYTATHLEITQRAAASLLERACKYGMVQKMGNARRGMFYQAPDLLALLEEAASIEGIRRLLRT
jgi:Fic family protein